MKNSIVFLLAASVGVSGATAGDIALSSKNSRGTGIRIVADQLSNEAEPVIVLEASVDKLTTSVLKTPNGTFSLISIPGFQHTGDIGSPSVPVMNRLIEVPVGAELSVTVTSQDSEVHDLAQAGITAPLFPRQPPQPKNGEVIPFAYEASSYTAAGYQEESLVSIEEVGVLRHTRLALLKVAPVAYDPVKGKIEVRNNLRITVSLKGADLAKTAKMKRDFASPYFDGLMKQTLVPASIQKLSKSTGAAPCYLIVSDRQFETQLEPFIRWKSEKGFDVVTAYTDTVGTESEAILAHIKALYNDAADDHAPPSFVLFVGDVAQVKPFQGRSGGWSSHVTDLYFTTMTDGDNLPDILYGRFSANNAEELAPQLAKTLEYEKFQMADPSFLEKVVLIAGWDYSHTREWGWPQIKYGTKFFFKPERGIKEATEFLTTSSDQFSADIIAKVSAGAGFVNYTAHGSQTSWADPGFEISDIESLGNEGKYPLVVGNCCVTNSFQIEKCFGEAWLRAAGRGAIGYIGGSNNTYWDEDLWWGNGYYAIAHPNENGDAPTMEETGEGGYEAAFDGQHYTNGAMVLAGNIAVEASTTSRKLYYWEIYHLMGDPSLAVYWGLPTDNAVEHPDTVSAKAGTFTVKAAPGSLVALTVDGKLIGSAFAGAEGQAELSIQGLPASGTATIVATGKNLKPYTGTIAIGDGQGS